MDSSITDNEMIYIQTCLQGIVNTNFIRCCQVQHGKAEDIVTAVKRAMVTVIDWKEFLAKLLRTGIFELFSEKLEALTWKQVNRSIQIY